MTDTMIVPSAALIAAVKIRDLQRQRRDDARAALDRAEDFAQLMRATREQLDATKSAQRETLASKLANWIAGGQAGARPTSAEDPEAARKYAECVDALATAEMAIEKLKGSLSEAEDALTRAETVVSTEAEKILDADVTAVAELVARLESQALTGRHYLAARLAEVGQHRLPGAAANVIVRKTDDGPALFPDQFSARWNGHHQAGVAARAADLSAQLDGLRRGVRVPSVAAGMAQATVNELTAAPTKAA